MQLPYAILLCHGYRVIHHCVIKVALLVEGNSVGLRVALFVRRADADRMFPGLGLPIKIPADPSGGDVGLPEPGRLPVLALAQTVLHCSRSSRKETRSGRETSGVLR